MTLDFDIRLIHMLVFCHFQPKFLFQPKSWIPALVGQALRKDMLGLS